MEEIKEDERIKKTVCVETKDEPPRDFQSRHEDLIKYGTTRGCRGCSSYLRYWARQAHDEHCRIRFEQLLKDEARVKNAKRRMEEFEGYLKDKKAKRKESQSNVAMKDIVMRLNLIF